MVFHEPMTALNPVMRIGDQIAEVFDAHQRLPAAEKRRRILAALADVSAACPIRRRSATAIPSACRAASASA